MEQNKVLRVIAAIAFLLFLSQAMKGQCPDLVLPTAKFDTRISRSENVNVSNRINSPNITLEIHLGYNEAAYFEDPASYANSAIDEVKSVLSRYGIQTTNNDEIENAYSYATRLTLLINEVNSLKKLTRNISNKNDREYAIDLLINSSVRLDKTDDLTTCVPPYLIVDSVSGDSRWVFSKKKMDSLGIGYTVFQELSSGRIGVKYGTKWGYLNTSGELVIDAQFDTIHPFEGSYALVSYVNGNKFIDTLGNELPIDLTIYNYVDDFSDGVAMVGIKDYSYWKYNYIDNTGKLLFTTWFGNARRFNFGKAPVYGAFIDKNKAKVNSNIPSYQWYFIDKLGNTYLDSLASGFQDVTSFNHLGLASFNSGGIPYYGRETQGLWGIMDTAGRIRLKPEFTFISPFEGGWAGLAIQTYYPDNTYDFRYGFVNSRGNQIGDTKYFDLSYFDRTCAIVCTGYDTAIYRFGQIANSPADTIESITPIYTILNNRANDLLYGRYKCQAIKFIGNADNYLFQLTTYESDYYNTKMVLYDLRRNKFIVE